MNKDEKNRAKKRNKLFKEFMELTEPDSTKDKLSPREKAEQEATKEFSKTYVRRYIEYKVRSIGYLIRFAYNATKWLLFSGPQKQTGFPHSVKNYANFEEIKRILEAQEEKRQDRIKKSGKDFCDYKDHLGISYIGEINLEGKIKCQKKK